MREKEAGGRGAGGWGKNSLPCSLLPAPLPLLVPCPQSKLVTQNLNCTTIRQIAGTYINTVIITTTHSYALH